MTMDSQFTGFADYSGGFEFDDKIVDPSSSQASGFGHGVRLDNSSLGWNPISLDSLLQPGSDRQNSAPSWGGIPERESTSPSEDSDFSDTVLKYISQVLMEEDMEEKPCMFHDALALQAAEKSLYEALGEKYPPSPDQPPLLPDQKIDSPDDCCSGGFSDYVGNSSTTSSASTSTDTQWSIEITDGRSPWLQTPIPSNFVFRSASRSAADSSPSFSSAISSTRRGVFGPGLNETLVSNIFNESDLVRQFQRGVEEASKFLPKGNQLIIDLENNGSTPDFTEKGGALVVKEEDEGDNSPNRYAGKKSHEREDDDLEERRSSKQTAISSADETELSEMFDKVLLCSGGKLEPFCILHDHSLDSSDKKPREGSKMPKDAKSRGRKPGNKREVVDLRTLLILCAQAASSDDRRTANELLKQIRQHSLPFGDGSQRLAHHFANSLEARLAGTGTQIYTALSSKKTSAADMLKAYHAYISVCPFKKIAIIFANHNIMFRAAQNAPSTLHIIDFGISYGFQWPAVIHRLSMKYEGNLKLRITGIELPQRGFRPAEGVQETGKRLAKYCERFGLPFEYNAIAQKWETIKVEDLKIAPNEFVAVNCLFRLKNLVDETVVVNSPRDAVLNLIRKINPNIFVQAVLSGSYNAPFFVTRFREALFHYSALFDMCDTNMPREDQMRLMFEKEFYGREIMNVVACEGTERVERPETYKQWQVRTVRAGFSQLPLDPELVRRMKCKVRAGYHQDFVVDEDGNWVLQGWKGRIVYASSCWVPA